MMEGYIEFRAYEECCNELGRVRKKAAALSDLLRYVDLDAMSEDGVPVHLFDGLAELCWDIATDVNAIENDLFPDQAEVLQRKAQGNSASQQKAETNSQQVSSERG